MNTYQYEFTASCPSDGDLIRYALRIESRSMIKAEEIVAACKFTGPVYHEDLADRLARRFGGRQTILARHRGVLIQTVRGEAEGAGR